MASSTLRKALGAVKDQTSITLVKVGSTNAPDLDAAVVKATSHNDTAVDEKYVLRILQLTSMSRAYANACLVPLAKRLSKTHNWIVAVKVLALIHRLLRDGNAFFKGEFSVESRRILNLSNFKDESCSKACNYSTFVRSYAAYLIARMDCFLFDKELRINTLGKDESYILSGYDLERPYRSKPSDDGSIDLQTNNISVEVMEPHSLLNRITNLLQILERVLACRPTAAVRHYRIVHIAMYAIVKESFQIYEALTDGISTFLDAYLKMERTDSEEVLEVYTRFGKQSDALQTFYNFMKDIGVCRDSEYPSVEKISEDVLRNLEKHLRDRDRSPSPSQLKRPKANEAPRQPIAKPNPMESEAIADQKVVDSDTKESVFGMRSSPSRPTDQPLNESSKTMKTSFATLQSDVTVNGLLSDSKKTDFNVNLTKGVQSLQEKHNKLALSLFSSASLASASYNSNWETFDTPDEQGASRKINTWQASPHDTEKSENSQAAWEAALDSEASKFTKLQESSEASNLGRLLLNSMYDYQGNQVSILSGDDVSLPARPSPEMATTAGENPFAAPTFVPAPCYHVQMTDLKQKHLLLLKEQQLIWQHYQTIGMQGGLT